MKLLRRLLTLITITSVLYSCESDKDSKIFFSELQNVDTLSVFTGKLAELGLKEDSPYTVFALSNSSITSTKSGISTEQINNHVFSGAFSLSELTNGKKLTSINGKEFKIKEFNNSKYINNSKIDKHIGSFGNSQFFSVSELILEESEETKSMEFTVYDYSNCNKDNLTPTLCENTVVKLYKSSKSFDESNPLTQTTTDKNGVATFYNLKEGNYRIIAEKGELKNIKKGYIVEGVFKTQQDITNYGCKYAKIGDLRLHDLNGDGKLSPDDKINYQPIKYEGEIVKKEIAISSSKATMYDFRMKSGEIINGFKEYVQKYNKFQAVISRKYDPGMGAWKDIYSGTFKVSDAVHTDLWNISYRVINYSVSLLQDIPQIGELDAEDKKNSIASVKLMRGLIYWYNKNIWGELPIVTEANKNLMPKSSLKEIDKFISYDLNDAIADIGDNDLGDSFTKELAHSAMARLNLLKKDYNNALQHLNHIINSGRLTLESDVDNIFTDNSSESIFNFKYASEFNKGDYIQVVRYTETLLMAAECYIQIGDMMKATMYMNMIQQRSGKQAIQTMNSQELLNKVDELWDEELNREGWEFTWLKYRGIAATELNIPEQNLVMPIPQSVIDNNSNITQNPGY